MLARERSDSIVLFPIGLYMSGLEIHQIVGQENINTKEGIGSKFSQQKKDEIEFGVDKRLLQGDEILGKDKNITDQLSGIEKRLFQPHESTIPTIDLDKNRGSILKLADEDKDGNLETNEYNKHKDGNLETNEYNKHKDTIAAAFVRSKQEYFPEIDKIDAVGESEKKLVFNDVHNQLASLQNSIFSTNSANISSNNYDSEKIAGNSVSERVATNSLSSSAIGTNAFNYAQNDPNGIQARRNRDRGISV